MRKLALAIPLALVLAACGSDTKSCSSVGTPAQVSNSGCTLQPGTTVTVQLRATQCQKCAFTSPTCDYDPVSHHLDTQYNECSEDAGCGESCPNPAIPTFSCQVTTPATGSSFTLYYNVGTTGAVNIQPVTVSLDPNGGTSCTL